MLHHELPWFWADISIYPGNSGGPVVANDRLVGIVSSQAIIPVEGAPDARTRIPFGRIVKTRFVHALLKEQERRDRQLANPSTERKCNRPASPAGGSVKR